MAVDSLTADALRRLQAEALTYDEVGRTAGELPAGYGHLHRQRTLGTEVAFDDAARALMTWQMHARAGLRVAASSPDVVDGAVVVMRAGPGRVALAIPCRVVYVVDEPDRRGFAYGTLPGHPESGEESFVVHHRPDGRVEFTVTAFSRPASVLARLGGPVTRSVQRLMTDRYLRALG